MTAVFIFAEKVQEILRKGKKEIEIPEGTRISAAAMDLIRDNQIRISYVSSQATVRESTPGSEEALRGKRKFQDSESGHERAIVPVKDTSTEESNVEVSQEELEAVVNRVIERLRELKGTISSEQLVRGTVPAEDDDLVICRCEEITKGEIKDAIRNGMKTLNGIKRVTRAGMGLCQGQTCQGLVTQILASELGVSPAEVEPTTARAPVRPIRLSTFATG